jgi:LuxR family maltose regulon positive regulatory protein
MKVIPRLNLNKLIDKGLNYPLVLIVAAPGSGKSTSLGQWITYYETQPKEKLKIIHFDAAAKFNEGDILFEHIFKRLSAITPLWEASFFKLFKTDQEADKDTLIDIFIQGFSQIPHPIVIAIDDFHHIKSKRITDIFTDLINRLPAHITFILSSRNYPNLSISKFKLEERVLIIDGNDLRLDKDELSTLNQLLCDSQINEQRLQVLLDQTEGWFVGIKLALLAYTKDGDIALEGFSGTQPELLNYFAHEIISKLQTELKNFILSTSICSSFNQVLCDAINDDSCRLMKLEELTQHALLITPDPDEPNWFRFHPLLQSFLLQRLEIEKGEKYILSLHLKAAKSLLAQNKTSLAIHHARQSKDEVFYFDTLLNATNEWLKKGEFGPVMDALNELSEQEFSDHSHHHLNLIYALTFSRRFNQASLQLEQYKQKNRSPSEIDTIRFLGFLIELFQSDSEVQNLNLPKNRVSEHTQIDVVGFYLIIEAYNCMYNGLLNEAFKLATKAKHLLITIEHDFFLSFANLILILCDRYLGRGIEAIELMLSVFNPIKHGPKTPVWINFASGMIVVDYEQNRLEEALDLGEQLILLSSHSSITEVIVNAYLYSARISHIFGNKNKAKRLLDQLERILSLGDYQRFNSQVVHEKMRQAIQEPSGNTVEQLYKHYALAEVVQQGVWHKTDQPYEEHRERLALACVYALIAKGRFKQATEILNAIVITLDKQNLPTRALIARSNLAMISFRQDKTNAATQQLKRLIERYGLVCFSRTIFDEVPGLEKLFQHAIDENILVVPPIFTEIFSSLFHKQQTEKTLIQPAQLLTEKEGEIFELLSAGLSNAAISKQSGIALSTTKWHLKNIYLKLGVENRSSALMLAHKVPLKI